MLKVYGLVAVVMFMSMLGGGAYYYYTTTQNTIAQLTENNATLKSNQEKLEGAVATANETIAYQKENFESMRVDYQEAQKQLSDIRQQNNRLRERLSEHDISALAEAKPELVERIINNASEKAMRCFELLSGAPLTDDERNAENGKDFNNECPWIYDSLIDR